MSDPTVGRADILETLGEPTRLKIIDFLREGERSVCEILPAIGEDEEDTLHHLNLMLAAGILSRSKEGMMIFYAIKYPEVLKIADLAADAMLRENGLEPQAPARKRRKKLS